MKHIIFTLLIYLLPISLFADDNIDYIEDKPTDANISGHVLSQSTNEHLPYMSVEVKGTSFYTRTDKTGHFFFRNLPIGTFIIEVSGMGYTKWRLLPEKLKR